MSSQSLGGTFLDWSLHFLSGQTRYYHALLDQWLPLAVNPVTKINAHGHKKNHPSGYQYTREIIEKLKKKGPALCSYYAGLITPDLVAEVLGINTKSMQSNEWQHIVEATKQDFQAQWLYCCANSDSMIFISLPPKVGLYKFFNRNLDRMLFENRAARDYQEVQQQFDEIFFRDSKKFWDDSQLTNIWDQRERLALCLRPFDMQYAQIDDVDLTQAHFNVNSTDLWHRGDMVVKEIMHYCDLEISLDRFQSWSEIYAQWQTIQKPIVDFVYSYDDIIAAIIANKSYDLPDLSFEQEVVIQHGLIYRHNLNLKTWQLTKFPSNTQQLHALLEPNIHPISIS